MVLTLSKPDYLLKVNLTIKGTPPSGSPEIFCYSFDSADRQSFAEADTNFQAILPLVRGSDTDAIEVSCSAHYPDIANEAGTVFWGNATYVPSGQFNSGTLNIELSDYGRFYNQEAFTFDAAAGASFTLQDGTTTVEIPAMAVASSGLATMYVGSAKGYSFEKGNFPLLGYEIKFQVDGDIVSDMTLPVTIRFLVDETVLARFDGSINNLKAGSFEAGSRIWREDATYSYDASTRVLSVKVTHFSIWGLLVDLLARLTGQPTPTPTPAGFESSTPPPGNSFSLIPYDLTAKLIKRGNGQKASKAGSTVFTYRICWKAPYGVSSSTTYELQTLLKPKSKKNRKALLHTSSPDTDWSKGKKTRTRKTCASRNFEAGTASARVRVKDGQYSSSISFRTGR